MRTAMRVPPKGTATGSPTPPIAHPSPTHPLIVYGLYDTVLVGKQSPIGAEFFSASQGPVRSAWRGPRHRWQEEACPRRSAAPAAQGEGGGGDGAPIPGAAARPQAGASKRATRQRPTRRSARSSRRTSAAAGRSCAALAVRSRSERSAS